MGNYFTKKTRILPELQVPEYKGAGCLFTDGKVSLAGYNHKKRFIGGFGGKRELSDADYLDTAFRETIEELLEWEVDADMLHKVRICMPKPLKEVYNNKYSYVTIVYTFDTLKMFLGILDKMRIISKMYQKFPTTLEQLILGRYPLLNAEITTIGVMPVAPRAIIDNTYRADLRVIGAKKPEDLKTPPPHQHIYDEF